MSHFLNFLITEIEIVATSFNTFFIVRNQVLCKPQMLTLVSFTIRCFLKNND